MKEFLKIANARQAITLLLICLALALCLRGLPGNLAPNGKGNEKIITNAPPFETSMERGRYAQVIAIADYGTFSVDTFFNFLKPDLAWYNGHYYSAFPPGVAFLSIPFYMIGKTIGLSQIFTFSVPGIFTVLTTILIFHIAKLLHISKRGQLFAGLLFAIGSTAFVYSVTYSAHTVSAAIISACFLIYLLLKRNSQDAFSLFCGLWFLFSLNLFIDYPNLFILMPLLLFSLLSTIRATHDWNIARITIPFKPVLSLLGASFVIILFVWFNLVHYNRPFALTNTFNLKSLEFRGIQFSYDKLSNDLFDKKAYSTRFQPKRFITGAKVLLTSEDRGLFLYSPAFLLAIIGFFVAYKKRIFTIFVAGLLIVSDIFIYGSFDDPWGGWSFGPRYLIPTLPLFAVIAATGFDAVVKRGIVGKILVSVLLITGVIISVLGALTTTAVPPSVEAIPMHMADNFILNWQMLQNGMNSSFFYIINLKHLLSPVLYDIIVSLILAIGILFVLWMPEKITNEDQTK